jgi:hypothetical protein
MGESRRFGDGQWWVGKRGAWLVLSDVLVLPGQERFDYSRIGAIAFNESSAFHAVLKEQ